MPSLRRSEPHRQASANVARAVDKVSPDPQQPIPPPAALPPPQVSPDGRFWWNGSTWVPFGGQVGATPMIAPKQPIVHLLASIFIPGLGTILAGRKRRGALILCGFFLSYLGTAALLFVGSFLFHAAWLFMLGWLVVFSVWIFAIVDAYRSAQAWNRERGIMS